MMKTNTTKTKGLDPKLFNVSKKSCVILLNKLILLYINKYYIK